LAERHGSSRRSALAILVEHSFVEERRRTKVIPD
jgi:hypothetical protein